MKKRRDFCQEHRFGTQTVQNSTRKAVIQIISLEFARHERSPEMYFSTAAGIPRSSVAERYGVCFTFVEAAD
jgi:hypothetical protein